MGTRVMQVQILPQVRKIQRWRRNTDISIYNLVKFQDFQIDMDLLFYSVSSKMYENKTKNDIQLRDN